MAIRAKHVQDEIKKAEEATANASVVEKVIIKLITVGLRVLLTVRLNQVKIMEKLGVEKIQHRQRDFDYVDKDYRKIKDINKDGTDEKKVEDVENK